MTTAIHPGGLNATQSIAFFRANGITGVLVKSRHKRHELRSYTCLTRYLDESIDIADHRILALREHHVIA